MKMRRVTKRKNERRREIKESGEGGEMTEKNLEKL